MVYIAKKAEVVAKTSKNTTN